MNLLAETQPAEIHIEEIIRRQFAGGARQLHLRQAQLFGEQIERRSFRRSRCRQKTPLMLISESS